MVQPKGSYITSFFGVCLYEVPVMHPVDLQDGGVWHVG